MFAVVFIPGFFLQAALRQEPDLRSRAVALIDPALPKPNIVQLTAAARARGVAEGLTPSQAMARCAELQIKVRSPTQEHAATDVLLQTAYAFASNIEDTAPGVCTMELKGLGLFGGTSYTSPHSAQTWAEQLIAALAQTSLSAQIGIASTPALALLAARAASEGRVTRVPIFPRIANFRMTSEVWDSCNSSLRIVRDSNEFISALPIAALDPTAETASVLERWGIRTVGALIALGKTALAERLGPEAIQLLDRVSPQASRPLKLVTPKEVFEEQMEFENEIETFEPLLFVLRRFVEQLAQRLDAIHLVVAELHLQLKLSSGAVYEHRFHIPVATGNVETLFRTLHTHLESVRTDSPIVALHIAAQPSPPERHQFGLFETTLKNPNQFAETLARLTALCGSDRVGTPVVESTHRPDVFRMRAPEFDGASESLRRKKIPTLRSSVQRGEARIGFRGTLTPALSHRMGEGEVDSAFGRDRTCKIDASAARDLERTHSRNLSNGDTRSLAPAKGERAGVRGRGVAIQTTLQPLQPGPSLRRFRPALEAIIEFRGERPALVRSSAFNGAIAEVRGPFLSSGDWWDRQPWSREEWDVQSQEGTLYRIFRSSEGCFVEGVYD